MRHLHQSVESDEETDVVNKLSNANESVLIDPALEETATSASLAAPKVDTTSLQSEGFASDHIVTVQKKPESGSQNLAQGPTEESEENALSEWVVNNNDEAKSQAADTALALESRIQRSDIEALMKSGPVVTIAPNGQSADAEVTDNKVVAKQLNSTTPSSSSTEPEQPINAGVITEQSSVEKQRQQIASNESSSMRAAEQSRKERRVPPEKYRNSPLLWIIEIKHLHKEQQPELVREELTAFRKKYPENPSERLLPKELQVLKTE